MASYVRWVRLFRIAALAVLAIVFSLFAFVRIQQYVLRWRAERLLADIREIQMGKSTWADAQRLMHRWGNWGRWQGACNPVDCEYQIAMEDVSHALPISFWTESGFETRVEGHEYARWQLRSYSILGGRVSQVYATFHVKKDIVWTKSYTVLTSRNSWERGAYDELVGDAEGTTHFTPQDDFPLLAQHPEYSIRAAGPCEGCHDGACTICEMIRASFTPFVDTGVVTQLFDFNLSCISSWHECEEPREIIPSAWRIYIAEQKEFERSPRTVDVRDWRSCNLPVEMIGRDYRYALQVEAVSVKTSKDGQFTRYEVQLCGLSGVKNNPSFKPGLLKEPLVGWSDTIPPGGNGIAQLKPGSRMIFLFNGPLDEWGVIPFYGACSYVPDTPENRSAIERGIARDSVP